MSKEELATFLHRHDKTSTTSLVISYHAEKLARNVTHLPNSNLFMTYLQIEYIMA